MKRSWREPQRLFCATERGTMLPPFDYFEHRAAWCVAIPPHLPQSWGSALYPTLLPEHIQHCSSC